MDIKHFLTDYVSFQSVSCDRSKVSEMRATRDFLLKFLSNLDFRTKEIKTDLHNVILAKNDHRKGRKSVLLYGHYDVQPAGEGWTNDPFTLTEKDGRLYARGASDNKGGNSTILAALYDIFTEDKDFPLNVTVILEGEEEIGSPSMPVFLEEHRDELRADFVVVADTWSIDDENIVITTGLRGIIVLELKLKSAQHDIHSGYGGSIVNPVRELARLCTSFHDEHGKVNVPGFYDDVEAPSDYELSQIKKLPFTDAGFLESIGAKKLSTDKATYSAIENSRFYPTLEFNGICGGYIGEGVKTVIPSEASAKISCRLVPNQDCERIKSCLRRAILTGIDTNLEVSLNFERCSSAYNLPFEKIRRDKTSAVGQGLEIADREIESVFGHKPLYLRDGGSIPLIRMMKDILGMDAILIGFSSAKDHIHATDESISIKMLERGREFFKRFLTKLSQ
ncbi:MAG: M20/M25/M40 family metallo-hydrolase [Puniceicoccales bacterium]|jgi:acetylornithine deacetylase/succinyl-diaminopimelate desuccinylase-like protein|nr:M20/M25/M40 family metallo-hydrolase [Puniceicoccales bacterium]